MRKITLNVVAVCSIAILAILPALSKAQDTIKSKSLQQKPRYHSPRTATIMSACLPGLGQVYNHKIWKVPIVYAALGTCGYFIANNNSLYLQYKNAYLDRYNNDPNTVDPYPYLSDQQLRDAQDYYRRYRDLNVVLIALAYTLNVIDANVDAHLFSFDVSDDLTLRLSPSIQTFSSTKFFPGASISLHF